MLCFVILNNRSGSLTFSVFGSSKNWFNRRCQYSHCGHKENGISYCSAVNLWNNFQSTAGNVLVVKQSVVERKNTSLSKSYLRMYLWWSLWAATVGDPGICCVCVTPFAFEHWLTSLCVDSARALCVSFCFRFETNVMFMIFRLSRTDADQIHAQCCSVYVPGTHWHVPVRLHKSRTSDQILAWYSGCLGIVPWV